jgi:hypothetical protein
MADDSLLISDTLASPIAELNANPDYAGAGETAEELEYALGELDCHAGTYIEARLYAEGRSPELFFLSDQARQDVIQFIDGFRLNFAGLIPATIADRMIVNAIDGIDGVVEETILELNQFYTWVPEAIYAMLIDGDHYVISLPGDDDDSTPVMIPSNAVDTRLLYDAETGRIPELGVRRWAVGRGKDRAVRANLYSAERGTVERFIRPPDSRWVPHSTDDLPDVESIDFIPFAHLRTRAPYGRPIHADAYGPQDMIVKGVMTLMSSVEFTGWPQRYALHKQVQEIGLPTNAAGNQQQTGGRARLRSGPGTVWNVTADAVGAFPAADLAKLASVVELAVKAMSQTSRVPMHYFDPLGAGSSGESRIAADQPVKASANRQRGNAGRGLREACIQTATLVNKNVDPEIVWAPDPVISDKTWWETAAMKRAQGVPQTQLLMEAGYTPDQIEEFEAENKRNAPPEVVPPTVPPGPGDVIEPPETENE